MAPFSDFQLLKQVTYQLNHIWISIKTKLKWKKIHWENELKLKIWTNIGINKSTKQINKPTMGEKKHNEKSH